MIPGREYTANDFLRMAWSRKWIVLVSTAIVTTAAVLVAGQLPDRFRAETLILAAGQSMSESYVRNTVASDTTTKDRLPSISQQILSRPRLEKIIESLDLYADLRQTKPMEAAVEQMRDKIEIKTIEGSEAFRVTYEAASPVVAMKVTEELAGLFIEENSKDRTALAAQTSAFLASQLEDARKRLVEQEKRLEAYRLKYGPELPTQLQSNLQVIQTTEARIQALNEGINRDRDRRLLVARQLADLTSEQGAADSGVALGVPGTSTAAQLDTARAELGALELRLTPKHPDLLRARQQVADLEARVRAEAATSSEEARTRPPSAAEIAKRNKQKELEAEIESLDHQVAEKVEEESEQRASLNMYQERVESVPTRESELVAITRDYDTLQGIYRSLLAKKEDSTIAEHLEQRQVIEQFKILDPPHLPERPFSPNRRLIDLGGALGGLLFGVVLAAFIEFFDKRVKIEADLRAVIDLPMLSMIPVIVTARERRRILWRRAGASLALLTVFAGCAALVWLKFRI